MSVAHEFLGGALPLAATNPSSFTPYAAVAVGITAGLVSMRKITSTYRETIGPKEIGVLLERGEPVERVVVPDSEYIASNNRKRQKYGSIVTEALLEAGQWDHVARGPGFYWVPPFKTLERVYVSDQISKVGFDLLSEEKHLTHVEADVTWNVLPYGDNPYKSITNIKHVKQTKKDVTETNQQNEEEHLLASQVLSICASGLGKVLTGKDMEELQYINLEEAAVTTQAVSRCETALKNYGVAMTAVRMMPVVWKDNMPIANALSDLAISPDRITNVTAQVSNPYTGKAGTIPLRLVTSEELPPAS